MKSGFALAGLHLVLSILNRRFKKDRKMMMDMNIDSYLPNLERALLFRTRHEKLSDGVQNKFWPIMKANFSALFDFRHSNSWDRIPMELASLLDFPPVKFDDNEVEIYESLEPNHVWFFSLGNYGLKRACSYLNSVEYERDFFEAQKLKLNSNLFNVISLGLKSSDFNVVRFRIPSVHKPGSINANGYHGIICYRSVKSYDPSDASKFELTGNITVTDLDKKDYYFSNTIIAHWCSCKTGQRTIGSCTHIISAIVGFGRPAHYKKPRFKILDPNTFHLD